MSTIIKKALCASALLLAFTGSASAALVGSNNTAQSIPDNSATGISSTINFGSNGNVASLSLSVAVDHTWVGDLIYKLTHGSTTVVLMDRPGRPDTVFGDSSNLSAQSSLGFSDAASIAAEAIGVGCDTFGVIGVTAGCTNTSFMSHQLLSAFGGQDVFGDWILQISDNAGDDTGRLASWSLNVDLQGNAVPEPGSLALLGLSLAGLAAVRRRRA